jgi:streptogramin lyase
MGRRSDRVAQSSRWSAFARAVLKKPRPARRPRIESLEDRCLLATVTEFPVPTPNSFPNGITTGPDGSLWFTELNANQIARITTAGVVTEFPIPTPLSHPALITGSDGSLWFTQQSTNQIGEITTAGVVTEFPVPTPNSQPVGITNGPDGNVWFTEASADKIGRITPAGVITEFPLPAGNTTAQPNFITLGPNGNLWFTEPNRGKIGEITTAGVVTEFPLPTNPEPLVSLVAGPDGNVWYTSLSNVIGRITPAGVVTEFPIPTANSFPIGITAGPDGALWFGEFNSGQLGRITTSGTITEMTLPTANSGPAFITTGPDGALWFTQVNSNQIGTFAVPSTINVTVKSPLTATEGQPFAGPVATFTDTNIFLTPANFTASINWGDGTTTGSMIAGSAGSFTVSGTHTYPEEGSHTIIVTVSENPPLTATATGSGPITVLDAPLTAFGITGDSPASTFSGAGTANATTALNNFRTAIGGVNNGNTASPQVGGRREVNWDGVALTATDGPFTNQVIVPGHTVGIPVNRFQARGMELEEIYGVSNDGFASANPGLAGQFPPFSPNNVFAMFNDNTIGVNFVAPSAPTTTPVPQAVRGFGAIFLDVETANTSSIEFFHDSTSLGRFFVPVGATGQPEFFGALFANPIVTSVELTLGQGVLFSFDGTTVVPGPADITNSPTFGVDQVATDDFAYAEPTAVVNTTPLSGTVGQSFSGAVAGFTDGNPSAPQTDYSATINWGDGTAPSPGTIAPDPNNPGRFLVSGTHTFAKGGLLTITTQINDVGGSTATATTQINVIAPITNLTAVPVQGVEGQQFTHDVATFQSANPAARATDFTATISWGDNSTSAGTIVEDADGVFHVTGSHTYAEEQAAGSLTGAKILVRDFGGATATIPLTNAITVADAPLTATGATVSAVEGTSKTAIVASFTDANANAPLSDFSATIDWGDGTTSTGADVTIAALGTAPNGRAFTVTGTHQYAGVGTHSITVNLLDVGGSQAIAHGQAVVGDAPLTGIGSTVNATVGTPLPAVQVATFDDTGLSGLNSITGPAAAGNFTALIHWGDGSSPSVGTISFNGANFSVAGSHNFIEASPAGGFHGQVTVRDSGGALVNIPFTANAFAPTLTCVPMTVTEGQTLNNVVLATVGAGGGPMPTANFYTATIDWGDGTAPTPGFVTAQMTGPATVNDVVLGSHTYAVGGSFTIRVTLATPGNPNVVTAICPQPVAAIPINLTAHLDPASDTGISHFDGITKDNTPTILGTSKPGSIVQLFVVTTKKGQTVLGPLGQTITDGAGNWRITTPLLPDGSYKLLAFAFDPQNRTNTATAKVIPTPIVIDTVGPVVTDLVFDRLNGQVDVTMQDNLSGLDQASLANGANYQFTGHSFLPNQPTKFLVTSLGVSKFTGATKPQTVVVTLNGGRQIRGGSYVFTVRSGGVEDVAGNALDGEFFGFFPSGNHIPGGDFVAGLDAIHNIIFSPVPVQNGFATPNVPPGTPGSSFTILPASKVKAASVKSTTSTTPASKVVGQSLPNGQLATSLKPSAKKPGTHA